MPTPVDRARIPLALAATLAVATVLTPWPASALRVTAQATAVCQGALPAFETLIRKRPLAVQNEGDANAFVTCSLVNPGASSGISRISGATIYLQNLASGTRTVSCTAVNSSAGPAPGAPLYLTRTVTVPRDDEGSTALQFSAADFPGSPVLLPGDTLSVSCTLPPGTGITGTVLANNAN